MKRWYQLSMLQLLIATAVVAVFIFINLRVTPTSSPDDMRSYQAGWPIPYMIVFSHTENHRLSESATMPVTINFPPEHYPWAVLANICVCGFVSLFMVSVVSFMTRKSKTCSWWRIEGEVSCGKRVTENSQRND